MNKKLLIALILVLATANIAYANDEQRPIDRPIKTEVEHPERKANKAERLEEKQKEIADRRATLRDTLRINKEEVRTRIEDKKKQIISRKLETVARKYAQVSKNIENLQDRLDSRIAKVEAAGGDATEAKDLLAKSRAELTMANDIVLGLKSDIASEENMDLKVQIVAENRNLLAEVRSHLKESRSFLSQAISSLKGMSTTNTENPEVEEETETTS